MCPGLICETAEHMDTSVMIVVPYSCSTYRKSVWSQSVARRTFHSTPSFSLAGSRIDTNTGQKRTCPVKNINTSTMAAAAAQSAYSLQASHPYQQSKHVRRNSHVYNSPKSQLIITPLAPHTTKPCPISAHGVLLSDTKYTPNRDTI